MGRGEHSQQVDDTAQSLKPVHRTDYSALQEPCNNQSREVNTSRLCAMDLGPCNVFVTIAASGHARFDDRLHLSQASSRN
jgi:hypothetical protein